MSTNDSDIKNYDTTPANNTRTPPLGAPEGMAPNTVNDIIRKKMSDIKIQLLDAEWFNHGDSVSRASSTTFKVPSDRTADYVANRRLKFFDSSTLYGTIVSSSFTTETTVTVTPDSGSLTASLTGVGISILNPTNTAIPENAVGSSRIADGAITTDKISNSAVTLAKMASQTQGDILIYDTAGAATVLSAGTSGQVLTTNGSGAAPNWQDINAGDKVLISEISLTSVETVTFSSVITSAYSNYEIEYSNVKFSADGAEFLIRFRRSNSTILTSTYNYAGLGVNSGATQITSSASLTSSIKMSGDSPEAIASSGISGSLKIFNALDGPPLIIYDSTYDNSSSTATSSFLSGGAGQISSGAIDGVAISSAGGPVFASGKLKLYGIT